MSDMHGPSMGEEVNAFEARLAQFQEIAQDTAGPLGVLLQRVAYAQQQYAVAAEHHGTTVGEAARLIGVVEAAMDAAEWLHAPGALSLDQALAEFAVPFEPDVGGRHRKQEPPDCEAA